MFLEMQLIVINPQPDAIDDEQLLNVVTLLAEMIDQMAEEMGTMYELLLFISNVRVGILVEDEPTEPSVTTS